MEEDFTAVVSYTTSPQLPGTTLWQPQILYSFKAPRGKLDGAARVLQTMVSSVRPSLKWYAGYTYVFNLWVQGPDAGDQRRRPAEQADLGARATRSARSTSEAWEAQQDSYDRVYGELSNQIRGVESYENPFEGRTVELPNDYRYAWVSSSGQYALSDSAGFDPNVGSTAEWRLLQTAR